MGVCGWSDGKSKRIFSFGDKCDPRLISCQALLFRQYKRGEEQLRRLSVKVRREKRTDVSWVFVVVNSDRSAGASEWLQHQ